jgi:asparagine synthase (glutamine-hydrolysing)
MDLPAGQVVADRPHSRADDAAQIAPLLSQPVVETCLRIATYLQIINRGERAVAREAFNGLLPARILRRRSKGGAEQLAWRMLKENAPFAREMLLDGMLVRERIVDRSRLEAAQADTLAGTLHVTVPLFDLLGAEIWVRKWS